jgi:phenylalanyl-tRNA synthetase beta chain
VGRRRKLVAIGTHDYDTIKVFFFNQGPFLYDAVCLDSISFKPLNKEVVMNGPEIFDHYSKDRKMKEYVNIVKDSNLIPLITDSNNVVLSLPPLINGDHSKITLKTKNIFVEMTAIDLTKAKTALNTIISMFSQVKLFIAVLCRTFYS